MYEYEKVIENISNNLKRYRAMRKYSQKHLAYRSLISDVHVARIEQKRVSPSAKTLVALANALDVKIEDLLKDCKEIKHSEVSEIIRQHTNYKNNKKRKYNNRIMTKDGIKKVNV